MSTHCLASTTHNFKWVKMIHFCSTCDKIFANLFVQNHYSCTWWWNAWSPLTYCFKSAPPHLISWMWIFRLWKKFESIWQFFFYASSCCQSICDIIEKLLWAARGAQRANRLTTKNYLIGIFTHLKLCLADVIHNFKWVIIIQRMTKWGQRF